jgi:tetratricopeptide (TPR) repeat protein
MTIEKLKNVITISFFAIFYKSQIKKIMRSPLINLPKSDNQLTVNQLWETADFYLQIGRINQSILLAYEAVKQDNQQQQRYQNHYLKSLQIGAEIAEEIDDYSRASFYWEQLTKQQPNNSQFWYGLGIAKANLGDYEGAKTAFNYCLQIQPNYPKAQEQIKQIESLLTP